MNYALLGYECISLYTWVYMSVSKYLACAHSLTKIVIMIIFPLAFTSCSYAHAFFFYFVYICKYANINFWLKMNISSILISISFYYFPHTTNYTLIISHASLPACVNCLYAKFIQQQLLLLLLFQVISIIKSVGFSSYSWTKKKKRMKKEEAE